MFKKNFFLKCVVTVLFTFAGTIFLQAQASFTLKGTVTDNNDEALIGVNIALGGTSLGTITDINGMYELKGNLPEGTYKLTFSYIGYASKTENVVISGTKRDYELNSTLFPDALGLDEVVVTGSSLTASRRQLGNAITSINGSDIEKSGSSNAITSLQGRVAGARITQTSGDPAGAMNINLRGVNSIQGGSDPLYVIDGVIVSNSATPVTQAGVPAGEAAIGTPRMADINPNDIESINVINGAAAAAIYGSRASNGVVLITTKRGVAGKPKITVGTSLNVNQIRQKVFISTYGKQFGFAALRLGNISNVSAAQISQNPGTTTTTVIRDGATFNLANNLVDVTRYDYQDNIFRTGIGTDNFVNVSGGSEKTKYYAGASFMNNQGIIENTDFSRVALRLNLDQILTSWASVSVGVNAINSKAKELPNGNVFFSPINGINITNNIWNAAEKDANDNLKAVEPTRINPLSAVQTFDFNQNVNRTISNAKLSLFPIEGLKIDIIGGLDAFSQVGSQFIPVYPYANVNIAYYANGFAATTTNNSLLYNTDFNISYNKEFDKFSSSTIAGYGYQNSRVDLLTSSGENIAPGITSVNGSANRLTSYGQNRFWIDGYFLQQTVGYNNQLFVTLAGRVDNSSIFSPSQRNQFYSKASLSYVVSESNFWKNSSLANSWNSLKLRGSFGEAGGVAALGAYDRFNLISSVNYLGKNTYIPSAQIASENVAPERTREIEVGADMSFFNNKVNLGFTYYNQDVFDLIVSRQLAASQGGTSGLDNVGQINNKGIELTLNYNPVRTKDFEWNLYGVYSRNRNQVVELGSPIAAINNVAGAPVFLVKGQPVGVFYGTYFSRDADGNTIKNEWGLEQTEKGTIAPYKEGDNIPAGSYVVGAELFTPVRNAAGLPSGSALRNIIGDPNPDFTMSLGTNLRYKRLNFGFLLDGVYGADVFNADRRTRQGVGIGDISEKEIKGELPRGYILSIYPVEEWRIESGSFTKLREVSLGYTFPNSLVKGVSDLSLTVIGRNLISFDNYDGYDPETNAGGVSDRLRGIDFGNVPIPRTIQFALRASF
ncbi:MAG: SusC/RagA family TonB-linked outer membrane protein [Saprospiraceae bacterium]|nr:SusC/RagA family TonB-linked outer membrane protein [Saprospiraceae bacterium]